MIIVNITGGLGNQMFQYATAKAIAKKNNDEFKLDISFYPKQNLRKYELNLLRIEQNIATKDEIENLKGKEGIFFKIKNKLNIKNKKPNTYKADSLLLNSAKNTSNIFENEIKDCKGNLYLDGYWQSEEYFKEIKDDIIKDFIPKSSMSSVSEKYLEKIVSSNSISLHIRRGDYVDNMMFKDSGLTVTEMPYYKEVIKYLNEKVKSPKYFIFSDDIDWCKREFDFLDNKIFIDDTKSAIEDMNLMSKCKHNVISNSTFSWWGAWLNTNPKKIVISPRVWFRTNHNIHLAPKEWIKI